MKKEYVFIVSVALIILAYIIDFVSGKLVLPVKNPYQFLASPLISQYPLTTVGIFVRSVGLFLLVWLLLSLINGIYFKKAITLFILFILSNLYSIQQLATGMKITPVQWTISIAYASTLLLIPIIFYLIKSTTSVVAKKVSPRIIPPQKNSDVSTNSNDNEEE